jgi:hypothetical protein
MKFFLKNKTYPVPFFFQRIISFLFLFLLILNCNTDREEFKEAKLLEDSGEKIQAMYRYEIILRRNPRFFPAHKRMGFLLSESTKSMGVASFHLEKAWEGDRNDIETPVKLFSNYIIVKKPEFARGILEEIRSRRRENLNEFMDWVLRCDSAPKPIPLKPDVFSKLESWEKEILVPLIDLCEKKPIQP